MDIEPGTLAELITQAIADGETVRFISGTGARVRLAGARVSSDGKFLVLSQATAQTQFASVPEPDMKDYGRGPEPITTVCTPGSNRWKALVVHMREYLQEKEEE